MKAKKVVVYLAEEADDSVEDVILGGPWKAHVVLEDGTEVPGIAYIALNTLDEIDEEGRWYLVASYDNAVNLVVITKDGDTITEVEELTFIYP